MRGGVMMDDKMPNIETTDIKPVDKKKKSIEIEPVQAIALKDNEIVAKGYFNTAKGLAKPGDIVCTNDLFCDLTYLEKTGLA